MSALLVAAVLFTIDHSLINDLTKPKACPNIHHCIFKITDQSVTNSVAVFFRRHAIHYDYDLLLYPLKYAV